MKSRVVTTITAGALFAGAFTALWALMASGLSHQIDDAIILAATTFTREQHGWYRVLVVLDEALQPRWTYLLASAICLAVGWRRARATAVTVVAAMLACWGLTNVVKVIVHRERPVVTDAVFHAPGYSFPSGHASGSAAVATALVLFFWPWLSRSGRVRAVTAAAAFVLLTCLDRVCLGVHFPTDVAAGTVFGSGLVATAWLATRSQPFREETHDHPSVHRSV